MSKLKEQKAKSKFSSIIKHLEKTEPNDSILGFKIRKFVKSIYG